MTETAAPAQGPLFPYTRGWAPVKTVRKQGFRSQ
jgi:hypothetical protein